MTTLGTSKVTLSNLVMSLYNSHLGQNTERLTVNEAGAKEYSIGSLLGQVTATGKYKLSDPDATDGSQVVKAVVHEYISVAATTDTLVNAYVRGPLALKKAGLVFDAGHDATEQLAAIAEIEAFNGGVTVR